jgi:hypothetical protein
MPGEGGGVRRHCPTPPRGPLHGPGSGARFGAARPSCPGPGAPRATRRFPARRLVGGHGRNCPRRQGSALPLAGGGLGLRHSGPPQPDGWFFARGTVWARICPRVGGGALAARHDLAWPRWPLGASRAPFTLVWLLFSGTTVMDLPTGGRLPGPGSGRAVGRTGNGHVEDRTVNGALSVTRLSTVRSVI